MDPQSMIQSRRASVEERIAALRAEIAALEQERTELDVAERVFARLAGQNSGEEKSLVEGLTQFGDTLREIHHISPQANVMGELEDIIRTIILETGRPMPRSEIVDALERRGVPLNSKMPGAMITMRLKRRGPAAFKNFEPQGWWPADVACPLMGYEPPEPPPPVDLTR